MDKYERQEYAVTRKIAREKAHDPLLALAPKRRKGSEIGMVVDLLLSLHELLHVYDLADDPPNLAGACETAYDAAVARLAVMIKPE